MMWLKSKAYAIGAALLAIIAFFARFQMVKNQRDKAKEQADIVKTQLHVEKVKKEIERKEKKKLSSQEESIKEEVKKKDEDFTGLDNLNNPNDW